MDAAIESLGRLDQTHFLVDRVLLDRLGGARRQGLPESRLVSLEASEHAKSYGALERVFLDLLERNLKRSGTLVVVGGGVLQDAGCFIASVLSRGIRWVLIPTTLLAQADSCIGSKSSINIGSYKNQIGTFYPPHRVLLVPEVLRTLPYDELRSGLGEVIKLQLLSNEAGFEELMRDLVGFEQFVVDRRESLLARWVRRSMDVKQPVIEADEFDRGQRLLLNYGHTFGHAYESVSDYGIPHGIAVILGMLTATALSAELGMVPVDHAERLFSLLRPWHDPYAKKLAGVGREQLLQALAKDKSWADYLMADGHDDYFPKYVLETGVPGQLGLLNFPEISMFGMSPWGGYGANPAPNHFEKLWGRIKQKAKGGAPYSEGIFEDMNKAIYARFYWNPDCRAEDTVKEYAAFEFSPNSADTLVEVVRLFEENHNRGKIGESARRAFELVCKTDATLTSQARTSWRWRIVYLRALIDKELFERKGKLEGETLKASFEELTRLYHAEGAHSMPIKPPQIK